MIKSLVAARASSLSECVERAWGSALDPKGRPYEKHVLRYVEDRADFESSLVARYVPAGGVVADLGAGWGALCVGMACRGINPILIDDYRDGGFTESDPRCELQHELGIEVRRQCITQVDFEPESLDGAACIAVLEHMHNSPRQWLSRVVDALKPGGMFLLGGPNSCHVLKRVRAVMGKTQWSSYDDWWFQDNFRGHVREPNAKEYHRTIEEIGLQCVEVYGRNFEGMLADSKLKRLACSTFDGAMRMRPGLCSDLYAVGIKPR